MPEIFLKDIEIRTRLNAGDLGYIIHRHGSLYKKEYGYGVEFEMYVAAGLVEFYKQYDPTIDRVWIGEHNQKIISFLLLMHRPGNAAQLRYFFIEPAFRGIGLGKKLMELYTEFLYACQYTSSYLWTTHEQEIAALLYKRFGYKIMEEKSSDIFGKNLIEQRYELVITNRSGKERDV